MRADEIRVTVRVRPGASRTAVGGAYGDALVIAVQAPAVDGRATAAACAALAGALGLRSARVSIVTGATSRTKVVRIDVDATDLAERQRVLALVTTLRAGA